jgi:thiol-disulfide isomerase/thioredoxin
MLRGILFLHLSLFISACIVAQESSDPVAQALSQGDLYASRRKYDLALDAYHKADKLSHHSSAACYLKIASVERKVGDLSSALDEAKHAIKAAGDNRAVVMQAHLFRATLLAQMAGKPTDKKLKESEEEVRQALAVDPTSATAHFDLGFVLLKQERDEEGIAELKAFLSMPGADSVSAADARRFIGNPIRARAPFAPDFSFITHEDQNLSNAALHGKVILMDFWGTWCPPCRESVPILRDLNKKYAGKPFQLVGISSDNDEDVWKTFIAAQHMDWSEYIDLSEEVLKAFKIESFPTYIVLDKDGVIRFRQSGMGPSTQMELEEAINKYLKRESDPQLAAAMAADAAPASTSNDASATPPTGRSNTTASPAKESTRRDAAPASSVSGIEGGVVNGNVYKNEALAMTFAFPAGWIAAKPESLEAINDHNEAAVRAAYVQQHPDAASSLRISSPKVVFYGSRRGDWDGQHMAIPAMRISAIPAMQEAPDLNAFQKMIASASAASNLKPVGPASEFQVNKHRFMRADFERVVGAVRIYESFVQTIASDYLLTIEIYGYSLEELQQVAGALQSMSIRDESH